MTKKTETYINKEDLPKAMTVKDVANFLRIGRVQAYQQLKRNEFHYVKIGNSYRICRDSFLRWFEGEDYSIA
ncbi:helix-turn-helix domain-containing protein [Paenibacillus taichungensis]|nr:helix-turn-helix domain-containing protein [Paenibacillus taichungensis]